ncbi:hypothetical protein AGLY_006300 [Aphis glycines]|uniref:Uncharacterized protein n=1 Tax=Aphis glycines TaxID=307491 RepID=A0A6G0TQN9_APHGL|nr:hypothetical protein AGLY_006300 [Aphis glycines]
MCTNSLLFSRWIFFRIRYIEHSYFAHAITQVVGIVTVCSFVVVNASQIICTCEDETICRLSGDQSQHNILAWFPFKRRLANIIIFISNYIHVTSLSFFLSSSSLCLRQSASRLNNSTVSVRVFTSNAMSKFQIFLNAISASGGATEYDLQPIVSNKDKSHQITVAGQSYVDTEAGFLLNEDDLSDKNKPIILTSTPNPILSKAEQPVEKRALEVWGSEEEVERQIELRQEKQKASKIKNVNKKGWSGVVWSTLQKTVPKPANRRGMIPAKSPFTPSSWFISNTDCNTKLNKLEGTIALHQKYFCVDMEPLVHGQSVI